MSNRWRGRVEELMHMGQCSAQYPCPEPSGSRRPAEPRHTQGGRYLCGDRFPPLTAARKRGIIGILLGYQEDMPGIPQPLKFH